MDKIDAVYYINLDYRTDRKQEFLEWIHESGFPESKIHRIQAVHTPGRGHIGCLLSHIKTLEIFLESSVSNCIIFEDDYMPLQVEGFWNHFSELFSSGKEFDLVMCSYNVLKSDETDVPFLRKVHESFTTSGYLITRNLAKVLMEHWKETVRLALEEEERTRMKTHTYTADVSWQKLMPHYKWYCFYPRIGIQRASFSDLQGHYTNYNA
jgi:glycosyl transferase family 25